MTSEDTGSTGTSFSQALYNQEAIIGRMQCHLPYQDMLLLSALKRRAGEHKTCLCSNSKLQGVSQTLSRFTGTAQLDSAAIFQQVEAVTQHLLKQHAIYQDDQVKSILSDVRDRVRKLAITSNIAEDMLAQASQAGQSMLSDQVDNCSAIATDFLYNNGQSLLDDILKDTEVAQGCLDELDDTFVKADPVIIWVRASLKCDLRRITNHTKATKEWYNNAVKTTWVMLDHCLSIQGQSTLGGSYL
jgi:hypothetical protein